MFVKRPVILFDGVCNLCNSAVQWVIERDEEGRFDFASLQSDVARRELGKVLGEKEIDALPDSIVLLDLDGVHVRSAAALRIARELGSRFVLLRLGILLPRPIRDAVYDLIARNRYRWLGRRDTCMTPTPEFAGRFLDDDRQIRREPEHTIGMEPGARPESSHTANHGRACESPFAEEQESLI
jgi:predicted DCC family thiol-disulfide oxidoreductase YuxK